MQAETAPEKVDADRDRDRALDELCAALANTDDPALIREFLSSILTEYEVREVATRWALVRLIDGGMSQRSISRALGLSLCKITRGSKELKKRNSAFRRMVNAYKELVSRSLDVSA
ncbi:MAG TPA: Trp family transcriptional regulator [Spirochaetia bacterium]|nr:Trp family transcriptional regulator [Spirochaetia bacterium]